MTTLQIPYTEDDLQLTGLLVIPPGQPRGAVMVVHGGSGLDAHAEGRARRFAEMGYLAFACDMYGAGVAGDRNRIIGTIQMLRADRQRLCRRADAGLRVLSSQPRAGSRVAVVGYCFGGLVALELARAGAELAAVVSVHGSLGTTERAKPGAIRSPILVCHGALDPHSPPQDVASFIDEMNAAAADWQLVVYGGAFHGFTHENATGQTPGVLYDARADARSSDAIGAFLQQAFAV